MDSNHQTENAQLTYFGHIMNFGFRTIPTNGTLTSSGTNLTTSNSHLLYYESIHFNTWIKTATYGLDPV